MKARRFQGLAAYVIAFCAVAVAIFLRWLLDPYAGDRMPVATLYGAVAYTVWLSGYRPAIFAAVLGYLVADYLFMAPRFVITGFGDAEHTVAALGYAFSCAVIVVLGEGMLRARERANAAADAVAAREQRLESMLRSISDAFFTLDRDWRYTYINDQAERYFGEPREKMLGRVIWEVRPQLVGSESERMHRRALATRQPVHFTYLSPASGRWLDVRSYPTDDGLAVFFLDVTDRKEAELALRDADRRKDQFLAVLAHELRNPLAPILNSVTILKLAGAEAEPRAKATQVIDRQVTQMTRLIDDLLDVSRIVTGKVDLRKSVVKVSDIVQQGVETARPNLERAGHHITLTLPGDAIYVDADPVRIAQVVSNLLNNAAKFTDPQGRIDLAVVPEGETVRICVKDTGVGIPPDKLGSIFEMFVQVDPSLERRQGGLGIGLTLVKKLVELHGGSVQARSDGPGRGSEFTVILPAAAAPATTEGPVLREAPAARRFLVVDDNEDSAESLAALLTLLGHQTATAHSGAEALEVVQRFKPQVILCDIGMPVMSGFEVARRLREMRLVDDAVTLIALTGYGTEEDRQRTRAAGFHAHLVKPVDLEKLEALLNNVSQPAQAASIA